MRLFSWLRNQIGGEHTSPPPRRRTPKRRRSTARLAVDHLESRRVLSATLFAESTTFDYNNDGMADYASSTANVIDNRGNLLSGVQAYDYNGDGKADSISSLTQSFDSHGNLLSSVQTYDWNE